MMVRLTGGYVCYVEDHSRPCLILRGNTAEQECYGEGNMLVTVGAMLVNVRVAAEHACYSGSHACYHGGYSLDLLP